MRGPVLQRTQCRCSPRQKSSRVGLVKCTTIERDVGAPTKVEDVKNGNRRIPVAPFKAVITGSTKGLGFELARAFLKAGDDVILSSRNYSHVRQAVKSLHEEFGDDRSIAGVTCDVSRESEVRDLADYARDELGSIHFWINNAGSNAYQYGMLSQFSENQLKEIIDTNVLGSMLCCKEAIRVMQTQFDDGHVFNMEGAGSTGNPTPRVAAYGATKYALNQFTQSMNAELKLQNISNIGVHILSPGMCTTDLLMQGNLSKEAKFFINCLAEDPQLPAEHLVQLVRQLPNDLRSEISSKRLVYLTMAKAYFQIFKRLLLKERKDRYVPED